ncbi:MAG TPA: hypothetical protein VGO86_07555 [Candidatus Dormibacteraeota bacterium]|jgi:hypothetical protein
MIHHLTLEARRPPAWLSGVPNDEYLARLRCGLGVLARDVSVRWRNESTLAILLRYEPCGRSGRGAHEPVLAAVVEAATRAGLHVSGAVVTRVASHWTQGAIAGALTGVGLSQTQDENLGPVIALAAIAVGAVIGAFVRREVPVFQALYLPYAGWRLVMVEPEVSPARFRLGPT